MQTAPVFGNTIITPQHFLSFYEERFDRNPCIVKNIRPSESGGVYFEIFDLNTGKEIKKNVFETPGLYYYTCVRTGELIYFGKGILYKRIRRACQVLSGTLRDDEDHPAMEKYYKSMGYDRTLDSFKMNYCPILETMHEEYKYISLSDIENAFIKSKQPKFNVRGK